MIPLTCHGRQGGGRHNVPYGADTQGHGQSLTPHSGTSTGQEPGEGGRWRAQAGIISVTSDADVDLQPFGGDQVPVPSGDVRLGSWPAPEYQAPGHHTLHDPPGGHGHHQQPLCERESPAKWGVSGHKWDRLPEGRDRVPPASPPTALDLAFLGGCSRDRSRIMGQGTQGSPPAAG